MKDFEMRRHYPGLSNCNHKRPYKRQRKIWPSREKDHVTETKKGPWAKEHKARSYREKGIKTAEQKTLSSPPAMTHQNYSDTENNSLSQNNLNTSKIALPQLEYKGKYHTKMGKRVREMI